MYYIAYYYYWYYYYIIIINFIITIITIYIYTVYTTIFIYIRTSIDRYWSKENVVLITEGQRGLEEKEEEELMS